MSGKETQPNNNKTSGGALAAIAVIQHWETASLSWWQPIIHRLQQDAGLGKLRDGKPQKCQAWWTAMCSSTTPLHSRILVARVCLGSCGALREVVAGEVGTPPSSAPCSPQPMAAALQGECRSAVLPFWRINRDQNIFHSYCFSCWARLASAPITTFLRKVGNRCGFRPLEWHWCGWPQMSTVLKWWCPELPTLSRSAAGCLSPHYSWVISCTTPPLQRGGLSLNTETKKTAQKNHFSCHSKPECGFHQASSFVRTSSKSVPPRVWVLHWIEALKEKFPAVVPLSAAIPRVNTSPPFPVPYYSHLPSWCF